MSVNDTNNLKPNYLERKCSQCYFSQDTRNVDGEVRIHCHRKLKTWKHVTVSTNTLTAYPHVATTAYPLVATYRQNEDMTFRTVREYGTCSKFKPGNLELVFSPYKLLK